MNGLYGFVGLIFNLFVKAKIPCVIKIKESTLRPLGTITLLISSGALLYLLVARLMMSSFLKPLSHGSKKYANCKLKS